MQLTAKQNEHKTKQKEVEENKAKRKETNRDERK